jgi:hypothetical protein
MAVLLGRTKECGAFGVVEQKAKQDQEREVVATRGGPAWGIRGWWVVLVSRRM